MYWKPFHNWCGNVEIYDWISCKRRKAPAASYAKRHFNQFTHARTWIMHMDICWCGMTLFLSSISSCSRPTLPYIRMRSQQPLRDSQLFETIFQIYMAQIRRSCIVENLIAHCRRQIRNFSVSEPLKNSLDSSEHRHFHLKCHFVCFFPVVIHSSYSAENPVHTLQYAAKMCENNSNGNNGEWSKRVEKRKHGSAFYTINIFCFFFLVYYSVSHT